jgi:hypothetical protein
MVRAMPQPISADRSSYTEMVVLTGDIIGSTKLAPEEVDAAMRELELASQDFHREWIGSGEPRFTRFRGDGWQSTGVPPAQALRAALFFRARLSALGRPFDTRISVGIGAGSLETEAPDLAGAAGPAFELSGRGLDRMPHARRFAVAWENPPDGAPLIEAIFALSDEISRQWTPRQAEVFARALGPRRRPNQEELAAVLGVKQQVIARHLAGGGDWALREGLDAVFRALHALEGGEGP